MQKRRIKRLADPALGNSQFQGDLAYGRCRGDVPVKHKDYPAQSKDGRQNIPIVPLKLVEPRDPKVWGPHKRPKHKKIKNSPTMKKHVMSVYRYISKSPRLNFHLIVNGVRV